MALGAEAQVPMQKPHNDPAIVPGSSPPLLPSFLTLAGNSGVSCGEGCPSMSTRCHFTQQPGAHPASGGHLSTLPMTAAGEPLGCRHRTNAACSWETTGQVPHPASRCPSPRGGEGFVDPRLAQNTERGHSEHMRSRSLPSMKGEDSCLQDKVQATRSYSCQRGS